MCIHPSLHYLHQLFEELPIIFLGFHTHTILKAVHGHSVGVVSDEYFRNYVSADKVSVSTRPNQTTTTTITISPGLDITHRLNSYVYIFRIEIGFAHMYTLSLSYRLRFFMGMDKLSPRIHRSTTLDGEPPINAPPAGILHRRSDTAGAHMTKKGESVCVCVFMYYYFIMPTVISLSPSYQSDAHRAVSELNCTGLHWHSDESAKKCPHDSRDALR